MDSMAVSTAFELAGEGTSNHPLRAYKAAQQPRSNTSCSAIIRSSHHHHHHHNNNNN